MDYAAAARGAPRAGGAWGEARSTSRVDDKDDTFEAFLKDFQQKFETKQDSMELVTAKVVQICNATLGAEDIRHTAISSRIKTWKSAEGSIRRKRDERAARRRLRAAVEDIQNWDMYCSYSNLGSKETRPFRSGDEMFIHLRDFGGVRISLYFPGDVERISEILKYRFKVDSATRKHQSVDVTRDLQRRFEELTLSTSANKPYASDTERSFSGYKATHLCVRLHEDDIPPNKRSIWRDLTVEIQVGTLVMHAWSEIEHDMIYKPLESHTISDDEVRLLDLINGIVATGESALRQLEASTNRRRNQRAKDKAAFATSHYELGTWLDRYLRESNVKVEGNWRYLGQLYAIMKATDHHQLVTIQRILEKTRPGGFVDRRVLPTKILNVICEPVAAFMEPTFRGSRTWQAISSARYWAQQLIYSLNMAVFLGVAEAFFDVILMPKRPQLADLLDVIHPTSPSHADSNSLLDIAEYCEAFLRYHEAQLLDIQNIYDRKSSRHYSSQELHRQLLPIAASLSRVDRIVISSELGQGLFIPLSIVGLFVTTNSQNNKGRLEAQALLASQVQHQLSFIEHYVNNRQMDNYDSLAMWDRMNLAMSGNAGGNAEESYLVPNLAAGNDGEAKWKLLARPLNLDVAKFVGGTSSQEVQFVKRPRADKDEIQEVAHRLHPGHRRLVDQALGLMLKARPANEELTTSRYQSSVSTGRTQKSQSEEMPVRRNLGH